MQRIEREYNLIVVGGGMAGICAAIAAARHGCRTALVQDRPMLGGNSSSEVRMHICGADIHGARPNARETGIMEELRLENLARNPHHLAPAWDLLLWEWVLRERSIELYLNTPVIGVRAEGSRIVEIYAEQLTTEKRFTFRAPLFVDASGDGRMAAEAGAEFRMGREARAEFGESMAPEEANGHTLGHSLMFHSRDMGEPVAFQRPDQALELPDDASLPHRSHRDPTFGYWWIEWGGMQNAISDSEEIRDELLRCLYGVWDHLKNHGEHGAGNRDLDWVGWVIARRESRRFVGDHILTESDLMTPAAFPDAVAYGGWPLDDHPSEGFRAPGPPCDQKLVPPIYSIPMRSLYSRNVENLFLAGRLISATHAAFSSTRVMATCAIMGQAVGTAAALATRKHALPREIASDHIRELQQILLADDCYIPDVSNQDPSDLARTARITASSSASEQTRPEKVVDGITRPLGEDAHQWTSCPEQLLPQWISLEFQRPQLLSEVRLSFDSNLAGYLVLSHEPSVQQKAMRRIPETLVRDYRVEVRQNGEWIPVAEVCENRQRHRMHRFSPIDAEALRVVVEATHGDPCARIFEIRCYENPGA